MELKKDQQLGEVAAALKKIKRLKNPRLVGASSRMIQATGYIGTQWILDLCNGIVKEGPRGLEVKCHNLQRERGSNGMWNLQRN